MHDFQYRNGVLYAEAVPVTDIADQYGTPTYVYSRQTLEHNYLEYTQALQGHDARVCYAVKANSNIAVLNVLARLGAGFDIVSVGELERVLLAGGQAKQVVFSGVGKQTHEMQRALEVGIHCFNIESTAELERLQQVASDMDRCAAISIRVNPDVDVRTHPYIATGMKENKFGISMAQVDSVYTHASKLSHINIIGVDCHIGSQLTEIGPYLDALQRLLELIDRLQDQGIAIRHLDLGGGLGVRYADETPPSIADFIAQLLQLLNGRPLQLVLETGRSICANAGILLTRVEYLKTNEKKHFAIVDSGMNDLLRPALYSAWQRIIPVRNDIAGITRCYDIVGPICETGDFMAKQRQLVLNAGDILAIQQAGAYGFAMASNYNSRNRAAEVMVDDSQAHLVRQRETLEQQWAHEQLLPHE